MLGALPSGRTRRQNGGEIERRGVRSRSLALSHTQGQGLHRGFVGAIVVVLVTVGEVKDNRIFASTPVCLRLRTYGSKVRTSSLSSFGTLSDRQHHCTGVLSVTNTFETFKRRPVCQLIQ
mmetsp:Transcript_5906/g.8782  ORF Transcript_5906/g.8782 Transcript_5906/m.8782 type:complete len:120 (+) Transcript_5906:289-648(+)